MQLIFYTLLSTINGVCVLGVSYGNIDMPYLEAIAWAVAPDCKWILKYFSDNDDLKNADNTAIELGLKDCTFSRFE